MEKLCDLSMTTMLNSCKAEFESSYVSGAFSSLDLCEEKKKKGVFFSFILPLSVQVQDFIVFLGCF